MFCLYQVYATSMAMLLTMVLSIYLFSFKPTLQVNVHALEVASYKISTNYCPFSDKWLLWCFIFWWEKKKCCLIPFLDQLVTWEGHIQLSRSLFILPTWFCLSFLSHSNVQLFLGIIICMVSLHMYFAPPNMLVDVPASVKVLPESVNDVSVDRPNSWYLTSHYQRVLVRASSSLQLMEQISSTY